MQLNYTKDLMRQKKQNRDFDSYAVLVGLGGEEALLTSANTNEETYFDIASMGKVLVTSSLLLQALSDGLLHLDDTLPRFFDNVPAEKQEITIKQLMTHTSGILRYNIPKEVTIHNNDYIAADVLSKPLGFAPGSNYTYSCTGFLLLGFILEKLYSRTLDELFYTRLKAPMGYTRSRFNIAVDEPNAALCCRRELVLTNMIDDEIVTNMRGAVAGNGGEFWGLCDIRRYVQAVLRYDETLYGKEWFSLAEQNYTPHFAEGRGLGYLVVDEKYPQTGRLFPVGSFGHCGHCGQSFFINREKQLYVIILTNATRFANMKNNFKGYNYGDVMQMRTDIHNAIHADLTEANLL